MATTTVVFTDVVASTVALTSVPQDVAVDEMVNHLGHSRETVQQYGGRVAKMLGDGVMALFESSYDAVRAAMALQQRTELAGRGGVRPVRLRVGIHVGEVIDARSGEGGDVFGTAIVLARRLCDAAEPGQILASDLVFRLIGDRAGVRFDPQEARRLHGFVADVDSFSVAWEPLPDVIPLRVVIAEDAALIRAGLTRLLIDSGIDVIAAVGDYDTLLESVRRDPPDLVITDIRMPPTLTDEGIRAAALIRAEFPTVAVLVLSQHVEPAAAATLLSTNPGAVGYLLKERIGEVDEFLEACRSVASGATIVDSLVTDQLLSRRREVDKLARLSAREREVLSAMAQGRSNHAIATYLGCSGKTIETHVRSIFNKLDLLEHPDEHRRVAAVVQWLHAAR